MAYSTVRDRVTALGAAWFGIGCFIGGWIMFGSGNSGLPLIKVLFAESGMAWGYIAVGCFFWWAALRSWKGKPVVAFCAALPCAAVGLLILGLEWLPASLGGAGLSDEDEQLRREMTLEGGLRYLLPALVACVPQLPSIWRHIWSSGPARKLTPE